MIARGYKTTINVTLYADVEVAGGSGRPATEDLASCRVVTRRAIEAAGGLSPEAGLLLFGPYGMLGASMNKSERP